LANCKKVVLPKKEQQKQEQYNHAKVHPQIDRDVFLPFFIELDDFVHKLAYTIQTMAKNIQFALLGFGQIGKKHAQFIKNCPNAELVAIIESNLNQIPAENTIPVYESLDDFFAKGGKADVVDVCTPNFMHAKNSLEALEHGCHVLCEKPMGLSKTECEKVIEKSLKKGKSVFVVMQNRYSATALWLKSLMEEKLLGKIYLVQTNCYWNRDQRYYSGSEWKGDVKKDGGVLFTQFSHFVDMLYWCFGEMHSFRSTFENFSHPYLPQFEDTGSVQFHFANGGMGILNFSTSVWDQNLESSITVIAEKGSLKIGGQYMEKIEYCHIQHYTAPTLEIKAATFPHGTYAGNDAHHFLSIQNVVETLLGRSSISTNAMEGLKVVEMIETMYRNK
jgi:predicted dehydrogenase